MLSDDRCMAGGWPVDPPGLQWTDRLHWIQISNGTSQRTESLTLLHLLQLISNGNDPNEAWDRAAARQKAALDAALAREKALKPVSTKKPKPKASGDAAAPDDAAAAARNGVPGPAAGAGSPPAEGDTAAAAATGQTADAAAAAPNAAPMANGVAHSAAGQQLAVGPADGAKPAAAGSREAALSSPPQDLSATDKLLVEASPLVGAWGEERYGFADDKVLQVGLSGFGCGTETTCAAGMAYFSGPSITSSHNTPTADVNR